MVKGIAEMNPGVRAIHYTALAFCSKRSPMGIMLFVVEQLYFVT